MYVRSLVGYVRSNPDQRQRIEEEIEKSYTRRGHHMPAQWFAAMLDGKDDFGYPKYLDAITTPPPPPEGFVEKPLTRGRNLESRRQSVIRECGNQRESLLRYFRNEKNPEYIEKVPGIEMDQNEAQMSWFLLIEGKIYMIPKNGKHTIDEGRAFRPVGRIEDALELLKTFQNQLVAKQWDAALVSMYKKGK